METKLKLESSLSSEMYPEVRQGSTGDLSVPLWLLDLWKDWMNLAKFTALPKEQNRKIRMQEN